MAHKYITRVRYNAAETNIDQVEIHAASMPYPTMSRVAVVNEILHAQSTFQTVTLRQGATKYDIGADVVVVPIDGHSYIKTVRDNTTRDNLGNLPRF